MSIGILTIYCIIYRLEKFVIEVYYLFVQYKNSNERCSGTILTGNTCVTVLVMGGGDTSDVYLVLTP